MNRPQAKIKKGNLEKTPKQTQAEQDNLSFRKTFRDDNDSVIPDWLLFYREGRHEHEA